jgi:plastocyanin
MHPAQRPIRTLITGDDDMDTRRLARLASSAVLVSILVAAPMGDARAVAVFRGSRTAWSPTSLTVHRGSVVKWRSLSGLHNVVAYGRNWTFSHSLPAGTAVKHRFHRRGTYRFRCTIHSTLIGTICTGMCGRVVVTR